MNAESETPFHPPPPNRQTRTMARVAPKDAPEETPMRYGSASGFRKRAW
jgi:hypothetical protein